ncbi:hypothetical protein [Peribacillus sp. NPDC058002]|uniref:hypothetical protein n=1 Tax=Peribacillus sp. NPDC058002 TaxID=3346301 RepID=UPI0036DD7AA0
MEEFNVEKKVQEHDQTINENILPRLEGLELEQATFKREISSLKTDLMGVQKGQKELEVTVMKDGKETRDLLKPFADHVLKQAEFEYQTEKDIAIKKMDTREKVFFSIFGTGGAAGIIAAIVTFIK